MLRTVETYVSYQGEGPNTSRPTLFVRFAGCNFKCPGWPCDTQHAIDPKLFGSTQKFWRPEDLAEHILDFGVDNVCLTGGEVFLQNQQELITCLNLVHGTTERTWNIEVFTNGGIIWNDDLVQLIDTFILDWKLPGSGEVYEGNSLEAFEANFAVMGMQDAIKFTIKDEADFTEAVRRYRESIEPIESDRPKVYAGIVWGQELDTATLCQWMLNNDLDWRLNVQVHKFVWHPDKTGV